ncbi:MAG: recombinase [Deltaproteobacteria bacterium]|nr:recombinase [Deltaproteobacteria bacterium]
MGVNKKKNIDLNQLKKPFSEKDIEWRIGKCGQNQGTVWATALAYITSRAIHDRLDSVCGPENWQSRYVEHLGETVCEIGIKTKNGWIWKAGGSERTNFEAFKGGLSGAEKRAGVPWGIGRYLYRFKEFYVETSEEKQKGWRFQSENEKMVQFYWKEPSLPDYPDPENPTLINVNQYRELIKIVSSKDYKVKKTLQRLSEKIFNLKSITDLPSSKFGEAKKALMDLEVKS